MNIFDDLIGIDGQSLPTTILIIQKQVQTQTFTFKEQ
jgi:hypothetical protein